MPKSSEMSDYEIKEATRFMTDVYHLCVKNLDRDDWFGEAWITYFGAEERMRRKNIFILRLG